MNFIDFHCHLDDDAYESDREQVIEACFSAGLKRLVTVVDPFEADSIRTTEEILAHHRQIFATVAAHPHRADEYGPEVERRTIGFLEHKQTIAVGEAGLDFHYNLSATDNQKRVFKRQIAIARNAGLPLIIHSRQAEAEVLEILENEKFEHPVVFHCYTGSKEDAREAIKRGFYISFSGIVTFKNPKDLRHIAADTPIDRLFTETDSPYLSPEPFRGKVNRPDRVVLVAQKVAEIKGITVTDLNGAIENNFQTMFPKL